MDNWRFYKNNNREVKMNDPGDWDEDSVEILLDDMIDHGG